MITNRGRGALYDLEADPAERRDLRFDHRDVFLDLGRILGRELAASPLLPAVIAGSPASKADREMLEVLGYVR